MVKEIPGTGTQFILASNRYAERTNGKGSDSARPEPFKALGRVNCL